MFDDNPSNAPAAAPANLPVEPEDMFKEVDGAEAEQKLPDALGAGLLKKKETIVPTAAPQPSAEAPAMSSQPKPPAAPAAALSVASKEDDSLSANQAVPEYSAPATGPILGKILVGVGGILLVVALGWGGWRLVMVNKQSSASLPAVTPLAAAPIVPPTVKPAPVVPPPASIQPVTPTATPSQPAPSTTPAQVKNDAILFGAPTGDLTPEQKKQYGLDPNSADTDGDGLSDYDEIFIWHTDPLNPDTAGKGYTDGQDVKNGYNPLGPGKLFNPAATN